MDLLFNLNPLALILLIPCLVFTGLAIYFLSLRNTPGSKLSGLAALAAVFLSLAYGAELLYPYLEGKILFDRFMYISITVLPVLWLLVIFKYTGQPGLVNPRSVPGLFLVPVLTAVLIFTNQFHHLFYTTVSLDSSGLFPHLSVARGTWFWINTGYCFILLLISFLLLLKKLRRSNPAYRIQSVSLFIAAGVPLAAGILDLISGPVLFGSANLAPFSLVISGLVITWSIFRHGLFSMVSIARGWIIENMKEGMLIIDTENILLDMNKSSLVMLGLSYSDLGKPITKLLKDWPELAYPVRANKSFHTQIVQKDGISKYFEIASSALSDKKGRIFGRLVTIRDITEWKTLENRLEKMATHDSLTGLPGRILLADRVNVAITHAKRKNIRLALIMLDLDHFKTINDTLGHKTGDEVLKAVSNKLKDTLRKNDTIARLGGDEFVVLLPEINNEREAQVAAERLLEAFQQPVCVEAHTLQISLSLGISIFPDNGNSFSDLLKQADTAMYKAKAKGGNRFELFESSGVTV